MLRDDVKRAPMSDNVTDVLKANVVFVGIELLNFQEGVEEFQKFVGTEIVPESVLFASGTGVATSQAKVLKLPRDRMLVQCSSLRSIVEKEYPTQEDLTRLAEITDCAIRNTQLGDNRPDAFGINIDLVFSQSSEPTALEYLATRLSFT